MTITFSFAVQEALGPSSKRIAAVVLALYILDGRRREKVTTKERDGPENRFEAHRGDLQAVAYRMLGSLSDAEDAVQETWLRLARVDTERVENLAGWLRTVVSRVCLDMLRSRASRPEEPVGLQALDESPHPDQGSDPERESSLVDSVGRALLAVLDTLAPAERIAFVLHDILAVPFNEIAPIVERSSAATKKLASRARHRVRRTPMIRGAELSRHRHVVEAFLAASRAGDVDALLALLAPDVVRRADRAALPPGRATEVRGGRAVAKEIAAFGRNARFAELALVNGAVGLVVAPRGRLLLALSVKIEGEKIVAYELIADSSRLRRLDLGVLDK